MGRKNANAPIKKKSTNNQQNKLSVPPKRWWQTSLETGRVIAAATVAGVVVAFLAYWDSHEVNIATWEKGVAHLEVADMPPSTFQVGTNYGTYEGNIDGMLYIADRGPGEALNPVIRVGVAIEAMGYCTVASTQGYGYNQQAAKIVPNGPPVGVDFHAHFDFRSWIYFAVNGGEVHVFAKTTFDDDDGTKDIVQWAHATALWEGFESKGPMGLDRREYLPLGGRRDDGQCREPGGPDPDQYQRQIDIGIPP